MQPLKIKKHAPGCILDRDYFIKDRDYFRISRDMGNLYRDKIIFNKLDLVYLVLPYLLSYKFLLVLCFFMKSKFLVSKYNINKKRDIKINKY